MGTLCPPPPLPHSPVPGKRSDWFQHLPKPRDNERYKGEAPPGSGWNQAPYIKSHEHEWWVSEFPRLIRRNIAQCWQAFSCWWTDTRGEHVHFNFQKVKTMKIDSYNWHFISRDIWNEMTGFRLENETVLGILKSIKLKDLPTEAYQLSQPQISKTAVVWAKSSGTLFW